MHDLKKKLLHRKPDLRQSFLLEYLNFKISLRFLQKNQFAMVKMDAKLTLAVGRASGTPEWG